MTVSMSQSWSKCTNSHVAHPDIHMIYVPCVAPLSDPSYMLAESPTLGDLPFLIFICMFNMFCLTVLSLQTAPLNYPVRSLPPISLRKHRWHQCSLVNSSLFTGIFFLTTVKPTFFLPIQSHFKMLYNGS